MNPERSAGKRYGEKVVAESRYLSDISPQLL